MAGAQVVGVDNMNEYYDARLKEERLAQLQQLPGFALIKGYIAIIEVPSSNGNHSSS